MSDYVIDPFLFCQQQQLQRWEIPLSAFPRLCAELLSSQGSAKCTVKGGKDELGRWQLILQVAFRAQQRCQRCLQPVAHDCENEAAFLIFSDALSLCQAEIDYPEVDGLLVDAQLDMLVPFEDELILALPFAAQHAQCDLPINLPDPKPHPFAILAQLKRNSH